MKTTALIEKGSDGDFTVFTPDIQHTIIGTGKTVQQAKADFQNSVKEMLDTYTDNNQKIPKELQGITFEYKFDLASFFDFYDFINLSKFAEKAGINPSLMRQYKVGKTYISDKQLSKIETSLNSIGKDFAEIRLI
jgi:predicted RNase H-like HicB family nuclease